MRKLSWVNRQYIVGLHARFWFFGGSRTPLSKLEWIRLKRIVVYYQLPCVVRVLGSRVELVVFDHGKMAERPDCLLVLSSNDVDFRNEFCAATVFLAMAISIRNRASTARYCLQPVEVLRVPCGA
jgi:hypothetical protein